MFAEAQSVGLPFEGWICPISRRQIYPDFGALAALLGWPRLYPNKKSQSEDEQNIGKIFPHGGKLLGFGQCLPGFCRA
jgi:hypothetical protein